MAPKLPTHSTRMLLLMKHLVDADKCIDNTDFLKSIGLAPTNLSHIKSGRQKFTVAQMTAACRRYKVNMNWLVGLEPNMMRIKSKSTIEQLKEAVRSVEAALK